MSEERSRDSIMMDMFIKDLVNEVMKEEFGVMVESGITEYITTMKTYIRSKVREEIEESILL